MPATEEHSLMKNYYENEKDMTQHDSYTQYITDKLDKMGMTNVWMEQLNEEKDFSHDSKLLTEIKTRIRDISSQSLLDYLKSESRKLTFLSQNKETHNFELYLKIDNFQHRRAITKIRTSSHKLEIETGRWDNTSPDQRFCKNCALNEIENEIHFIFECRMHVTERTEFFNILKTEFNVDILQYPNHEEKIGQIFSSEDLAMLNAFGKFVQNGLKKRETISCYIQPPHFVYYRET